MHPHKSLYSLLLWCGFSPIRVFGAWIPRRNQPRAPKTVSATLWFTETTVTSITAGPNYSSTFITLISGDQTTQPSATSSGSPPSPSPSPTTTPEMETPAPGTPETPHPLLTTLDAISAQPLPSSTPPRPVPTSLPLPVQSELPAGSNSLIVVDFLPLNAQKQPSASPYCNKWVYVTWGMTCNEIERQLGIKAVDIMRWNDVGEDCTRMWAESHVCVGVYNEGSVASSGKSRDVLTTTTGGEDPPITSEESVTSTGMSSSNSETGPITGTVLFSTSTTGSPESTEEGVVFVTSTLYLTEPLDTITEPPKPKNPPFLTPPPITYTYPSKSNSTTSNGTTSKMKEITTTEEFISISQPTITESFTQPTIIDDMTTSASPSTSTTKAKETGKKLLTVSPEPKPTARASNGTENDTTSLSLPPFIFSPTTTWKDKEMTSSVTTTKGAEVMESLIPPTAPAKTNTTAITSSTTTSDEPTTTIPSAVFSSPESTVASPEPKPTSRASDDAKEDKTSLSLPPVISPPTTTKKDEEITSSVATNKGAEVMESLIPPTAPAKTNTTAITSSTTTSDEPTTTIPTATSTFPESTTSTPKPPPTLTEPNPPSRGETEGSLVPIGTVTQTLFDYSSYITTTGTFYDTVTPEPILADDIHGPISSNVPTSIKTLSSPSIETASTPLESSKPSEIPQMTITSLIPVPTIPTPTDDTNGMEKTYIVTLTYTGTNGATGTAVVAKTVANASTRAAADGLVEADEGSTTEATSFATTSSSSTSIYAKATTRGATCEECMAQLPSEEVQPTSTSESTTTGISAVSSDTSSTTMQESTTLSDTVSTVEPFTNLDATYSPSVVTNSTTTTISPSPSSSTTFPPTTQAIITTPPNVHPPTPINITSPSPRFSLFLNLTASACPSCLEELFSKLSPDTPSTNTTSPEKNLPTTPLPEVDSSTSKEKLSPLITLSQVTSPSEKTTPSFSPSTAESSTIKTSQEQASSTTATSPTEKRSNQPHHHREGRKRR